MATVLLWFSMFPNSYFPKTYFPATYFQPATVTIVTQSTGGGGGKRSRSFSFTQKREIKEYIDEIERDDEELVEIIVTMITAGIIQ